MSVSYGQEHRPPVKRRRVALSCVDCRKRKLKCDREYPSCGRCRESRYPDRCTYDADAAEENSIQHSPTITLPPLDSAMASTDRLAPLNGYAVHPQQKSHATTTVAKQAHIEQLEHRIIGLERLIDRGRLPLQSSNAYDLSTSSPLDDAPTSITDTEYMMFKGKNCRTSFYGASHPESYLWQMPELRAFSKEMIAQCPRASQVRDELKASKRKRPKDRVSIVKEELLRILLPPKEIVDEHVGVYLDSFEISYRVLHLPTFWEEYSGYWHGLGNVEGDFIATVILMLAATYSMGDLKSKGGCKMARDTACYWIEECEAWLENQSQKHSTLAYMQAICILFVAKQMQTYKTKRTWTAAGSLMSFALTKGLHRDAALLNEQKGVDLKNKVSIFQQEMRRRLWSTIAELEMQASLERGMPATLPGLIHDCGPPTNCHDEDFDPSTMRNPVSQPELFFTRTSYQCIASKSWHLRQQIVSMINGNSVRPTRHTILNLDRDVLQYLDDIPNWSSEDAILPRSLLQLQFYQLLILLHRKDTTHKTPRSEHNYSDLMRIRAATAIIDIHETLMQGKHRVLTFMRQDLVSAALCICHHHEVSKASPNPMPALTSISQAEIDHLGYLQVAEALLEAKVDHQAIGLKALYIIVAAVGLVRTARKSADNEAARAGEKMARVMERLLLQTKSTSTSDQPSNWINGPRSVAPDFCLRENLAAKPHTEGGNQRTEPEPGSFGDFTVDLADWDLDVFLNF